MNLCFDGALSRKLHEGREQRWVKKLKWLETLQGYKVDQETPEPEFEKVPSRSLLIMARLGVGNDCLLSVLCNFSTLQLFNPIASRQLGERSNSVGVLPLQNLGLLLAKCLGDGHSTRPPETNFRQQFLT
jgi:hypothetical protein